MAFDGAGAVGDGEPGGDRGPVRAESLAEPAQLADRAGLGPAGPGFEVLAAAVAEHVGELRRQPLKPRSVFITRYRPDPDPSRPGRARPGRPDHQTGGACL